MELVYMYIGTYNGIIKNEEINFSNNFDIKMEINQFGDKEIVIKNKNNKIKKLYPQNLNNITLLLGKNSSGKTSILKILGDSKTERFKYINKTENSYIILYCTNKNKNEFLLEYVGTGLLKSIKNLKYKNKSFIDYNYKPYGTFLFNINNNKIKLDLNHVITNCKDKINFAYIVDEKSLNSIINYEYEEESSRFLKRNYITKSNFKTKYTYLKKLNENKELKFNNKKIYMEITCKIPDIRFNSNRYVSSDENEIFTIESITHKLYDYDIMNLRHIVPSMGKDKKYTKKEMFIMDFLSKYILYEFDRLIFAKTINYENTREVEDYKFEEILKYIITSYDYEDKIEESKILEFDNELELYYLEKAIDYYKNNEENEIKHLINISKYIFFRIATINNVMNMDKFNRKWIETLTNIFINIEDDKFKDKSIITNYEENEVILEFLEFYDKLNSESIISIDNYINIYFQNLSEGELSYFNLYSKIHNFLKLTNRKRLNIFLIDEPDQALHPEWCRMFIYELIKEIREYNSSIQFIISTHSPFMVSDIISENVFLLEKNSTTGNINIFNMNKKQELHNTFGSNIHELLKTSFILNRTMGEFAYKNIRSWIEELNNNNFKYQNIDYFDLIGEKIIRNKLKLMYNQQNIIKTKEKNEIMKLIIEEIDDTKINKMLNEIKRISKED